MGVATKKSLPSNQIFSSFKSTSQKDAYVKKISLSNRAYFSA